MANAKGAFREMVTAVERSYAELSRTLDPKNTGAGRAQTKRRVEVSGGADLPAARRCADAVDSGPSGVIWTDCNVDLGTMSSTAEEVVARRRAVRGRDP